MFSSTIFFVQLKSTFFADRVATLILLVISQVCLTHYNASMFVTYAGAGTGCKGWDLCRSWKLKNAFLLVITCRSPRLKVKARCIYMAFGNYAEPTLWTSRRLRSAKQSLALLRRETCRRFHGICNQGQSSRDMRHTMSMSQWDVLWANEMYYGTIHVASVPWFDQPFNKEVKFMT